MSRYPFQIYLFTNIKTYLYRTSLDGVFDDYIRNHIAVIYSICILIKRHMIECGQCMSVARFLFFSGVYVKGYIRNEMWHLRADFVYKRLAVLCLFFFGQSFLTCSSAEDCVWSNWTELTGNDTIQNRLRICGGNLTIESRNCDYDPCNGSAKQGICRKQKFQ